jgi:hypothetical protein
MSGTANAGCVQIIFLDYYRCICDLYRGEELHMSGFMKNFPAVLLLMASLFLMGADKGEQGTDELSRLVEQQKILNARIEMLKKEQDYLLFQKAMYSSDSKYLLINNASKTGTLKYKNRVLMDFHFVLRVGHAGMQARGAVTLTKKIEEPKERNALVFGNDLVLLGRRKPVTLIDSRIPRITLSQKDFLSIFYALDSGSRAYIAH